MWTIIQDFISFPSSFSVIGQDKSCHCLNQLDARQGPITTQAPSFSCTSGSTVAFTLIFHWLREIYSLNVIGRCACAGFGFTPLTTQMHSLQNSCNTTSHVRSLRIFQFLFKLCLLLNSLFLNTFLSFVSFKKPYLVSSFIHISFGIHLNSSPWVPSLDKVFLRKLKTKQNKNNL